MRKFNILITVSLYIISPLSLLAQSHKKNMSSQTNVEKWCHAIINLEVKMTSQKVEDETQAKFKRKEITFEECVRIKEDFKPTSGTAIFFQYNDRFYLLTARHVLEKLDAPEEQDIIAQKILLIENGSQQDANGEYKNTADYEMLIYLPKDNYAFSRREDDLAIVYLDKVFRYKGFVETLLKKGYKPITMDDIELTNKVTQGQEITSFGFPGDISIIGKKGNDYGQNVFHSDFVSLPVVSRGSVVDPLDGKNYFSGGIYVYPGNSGGPVVSGNKLVGIVSNQQTPFKEVKTPSLNYYIDRSIYFIKSQLLISLIKEMEGYAKNYEAGFGTLWPKSE